MLAATVAFGCSQAAEEPVPENVESLRAEAALMRCETSPCVDVAQSAVDINGTQQIIDCGGKGIGIRVADRTDVRIRGFEVRNCQTGILIEGGGNHRLSDLNVHDNVLVFDVTGLGSGGEGISLQNTRGNSVSHSNISSNRFGLMLFNANDNRFTDTIVSANKGQSFRTPNVGYYLVNSSNNLISQSRISDNRHFGVLLDGASSNNQIVGNMLSDAHAGIDLWAGSNNLIRANAAVNNEYGIRLQAGTQGNRTLYNLAFGNTSFDLADETHDCAANEWRANAFATDSEGDGPRSGCMR
jgi:parallel beta-helix repeat protein